MKKQLFMALGLGVCLGWSCTTAEQATFANPVIHGDMPDPSVIRMDDTYYATGTSSEWAPFYPIFTSKDLVNWTQVGHVFSEQPAWTSNSFWAPELFHHDGKVFCYYTARQKDTGISYIGVASADSPLQQFTDHGPIIEYGKEAIDAFVFQDNGRLYISWKAYGLDQRPIELLGSELSADGMHLVGEPFTLLTDDKEIGMEGQYHFKKDGYYYIIYAAHGCCGPSSDYSVYVARSKHFRGPYEKYAGNPILQGGDGAFLSCGHGTVADTPDGRMFYLCHAYLKGEGFYCGRQPILQELEMTDDHWVRFKTGNVAQRLQEMPFKGTEQQPVADFEDDFSGDKLRVEWTWNYPYAELEKALKDGCLQLTGMPKAGNCYGTALCLRPQWPHYSIETQVVNHNESFKGLTLYGDDKNLMLWGVEGNQWVLKSVQDGVETTLFADSSLGKASFLKVEVKKGCQFLFYRSVDGKQWTAVTKEPIEGSFLTRWDRVQRPGLLHKGDRALPAKFAYFAMKQLK